MDSSGSRGVREDYSAVKEDIHYSWFMWREYGGLNNPLISTGELKSGLFLEI